MSINLEDASKIVQSAFNKIDWNTQPKRKATDFSGEWQFVKDEQSSYHRIRMSEIVCNGSLSFQYTDKEWKPDAFALGYFNEFKEKFEELGYCFDYEFDEIAGQLGEYVDIKTSHKIPSPEFYYFDENDREPIPSPFTHFKSAKIVNLSVSGLDSEVKG